MTTIHTYPDYKNHEFVVKHPDEKDYIDSLCYTVIPSSVFNYSGLESLTVCYQYLTKVPKDISKLPHLRSLVLNHNMYFFPLIPIILIGSSLFAKKLAH